MSIKIGNNNIDNFYLGQNDVDKLYLGSNLLYEKITTLTELCLQAVNENGYFRINQIGTPATAKSLQYKIDNGSWTNYIMGTDIYVHIGEKAYLRATTQQQLGESSSIYNQFAMTGQFNASGNIMSLVDPTMEETGLNGYEFYKLFRGCTGLLTAPSLMFTTTSGYCCFEMFRGCTGLTTMPSLLPTTTRANCYRSMFYGCTSLSQLKTLPATTLYDDCYNRMFYGCTSLVNAMSELPATTGVLDCYFYMFDGCTSLVNPPKIKLTTFASASCSYMFNNCSNLEKIPQLIGPTFYKNCAQYMLQGCSKIKVSETQTGEYTNALRFPPTGTATSVTTPLNNMLSNTGGTFTGTPLLNTTYYTSNEVI